MNPFAERIFNKLTIMLESVNKLTVDGINSGMFAFKEMLDTSSELQTNENKQQKTKKMEEIFQEEKKLKCQSCANMDSEENFHICKTCNELNLESFENEEEVLKIAICSTCAIRKHIRQKHVIIDFLPLFLEHVLKHKMKTENVQNMEKWINEKRKECMKDEEVGERSSILNGAAIKKANELLESMREVREVEKQLKCQTCTTVDFEKNLQFCKTCNEQNLENFENEEEVLKIAICLTCAIKQHIKKKHVIIDFLPLFLEHELKHKLKAVRDNLKNFEKVKNVRKGEEQTWKTMNEMAETKFNELIELTHQSNSTKNLQQNVDDINNFIKTTKIQTERYIEIMKAQTQLIQDNLQKMDKWINEKRKECKKDEEVDERLSAQNDAAIEKANEWLFNRQDHMQKK